MKKQIAVAFAGVVLGLPVSGCGQGTDPQPTGGNTLPPRQTGELKIESTDITTAPKDWNKDSLTFSDDGSRYAFSVKTAEGTCIFRDGKQGGVFSKCGSIEFAPKTAELFYWAVVSDQSKSQIVLVHNDEVIPTEYVSEGWLFFSKDGKRWFTIGGTQSKQEGTSISSGPVVILCDGKELSRHTDASIPAFSPDGKHLTYLARTDTNAVGLYTDGKEVRTYKEPEVKCSFTVNTAVIGPNMHNSFFVKYLSDARLLILSHGPKGWTIYRDAEPLGVYLQNVWGGGQLRTMTFSDFKNSQSIVPWSVVTAESAPVALWWERVAGEREQWRIVRDGKPVDTTTCTWFWNSQRPVISANGLHCGYVATMVTPPSTNEAIYAVVDSIPFGPYGNVWGLTFSADGRKFAYAASEPSGEKGTWSFFVDGKLVPLKYESAWPPLLSPDGKHVAWKATRDKKTIVAIDGKEIATETDLQWGPYFDGANKLVWIVADDNKLIRRAVVATSAR